MLTQKSNLVVRLLFIVPALILLVPLVVLFPVGLGLKVLFLSMLLLSYIFGSIMPIVGGFENKKIISAVFLTVTIGFLIQAHLNSEYSVGKAKPNSLVYVQNTDSKKALQISSSQSG